MTSLTQQARVTSVPGEALHAHRARDACVTWVPSVSRQTSKAWGARWPQGPFPARSSWEAVLSWRPGQARLARRSWEARLPLEAWHSWHPLASSESRRSSLSWGALQPGVSRQSGVSPGTRLGPQDFSRKALVPWGSDWPWKAGGAWESVQAGGAHCTFGSSGPHKPWGSWESLATWISRESLQPWGSITSRRPWDPSEALGTWGAGGARLAWRSLGPSDTAWLDDFLSVCSDGPLHT